MPRHWVIAPVESKPADLFESVWQFDLANNLISIGWSAIGDVSKMSREMLASEIEKHYPDKPKNIQALIANMIWNFYHEIKPGDIILARRGRKVLAGVGTALESAVYSPGRNPAISQPHFLRVEWKSEPRDKVFPALVFNMPTLTLIAEDEYQNLIDSGSQAPPLEVPEEVTDQGLYVLEKFLEECIVRNFSKIFKGQMKVFEDSEQDEGQQYQTDVGKIDILAVESASKDFVVIELKKGRTSDQVVGQTLRYMGWVKAKMCAAGQGVKGLIICREQDDKLNYALTMTKSVEVRYYNIAINLSDTPEVGGD